MTESGHGGAGQAHAAAEEAARAAPELSQAELDRLSQAEQERIVSPLAAADERVIEGALRPKRLSDFIGQSRVREQLSLVLTGALRRGKPPDHVLLSGPPGLGKTTIAMIIAAELGAPLRITSGPAIERSGDLAAVLSSLGEGEVVFIDEMHRVARPAEEMLYLAMEDFRVDVVVGKGPGATAIPLEIAPFTLVGATTRACCPPRCATGSASPPTWTSMRPPSWKSSSAGRRRCSGWRCATTARKRSPGARAGRRGSPTGCCAGSATLPRSAPTGW